jgi:hypothetical protein
MDDVYMAKQILLEWAAEGKSGDETFRAEKPNAGAVREFCEDLLVACNSDGLGGCRLCAG